MLNADRTAFCCRVCGVTEKSGTYEAREMLFGLRTKFHYGQCATCGSLSLLDPPTDYSIYYSRDYYSFSEIRGSAKELIRDFLRAKRDAFYFGDRGLLGRFLARHLEDRALQSVSKLALTRDAKILDVGCGIGKLLHRMSILGFTNLTGVDPFLLEGAKNGNGVKIRKAHLEDVTDEKYDLVMFHHSLEHVADPRGTLQKAARLLAPRGKCLVRVPVLGQVWEEYGNNWVQLGPPWHMWIPTKKAMKSLADSAELKVETVEYDSTPFQFWGSELCRRDVPLNTLDPSNLKQRLRFREMSGFRKRAEELNLAGRGDQAVFVLSAQE
jgi:SAM-dependent methyltransferase